MGTDTRSVDFDPTRIAVYRDRIQEQYARLAQEPVPPFRPTKGAEAEFAVIDRETGLPLFLDPEVFQSPRCTQPWYLIKPEVIRNQGEVETKPVNDTTDLRPILTDAHQVWQSIVDPYGGLVVPIGTVPTLRRLGREHLSPNPRYSLLAEGLKRYHGSDITLPAGAASDSLSTACIGATTSAQFHLAVPLDELQEYLWAADLIAAPALASAANSPFPFGQPGWDESRISMLEQLTGGRANFGYHWAGDWLDAFRQNLKWPILLPDYADETEAKANPYHETDLLNGTTWRWNRVIRDACRIEVRHLPASSPPDMAATFRFVEGLIYLYVRHMRQLVKDGFKFRTVRANFYRAAKVSLNAWFYWPMVGTRGVIQPMQMTATDCCLRLLELAETARQDAGGRRDGDAAYIALMEERLHTKQTGAAWQRASLPGLLKRNFGNRDRAQGELMRIYGANIQTDRPIAEWGLAA